MATVENNSHSMQEKMRGFYEKIEQKDQELESVNQNIKQAKSEQRKLQDTNDSLNQKVDDLMRRMELIQQDKAKQAHGRDTSQQEVVSSHQGDPPNMQAKQVCGRDAQQQEVFPSHRGDPPHSLHSSDSKPPESSALETLETRWTPSGYPGSPPPSPHSHLTKLTRPDPSLDKSPKPDLPPENPPLPATDFPQKPPVPKSDPASVLRTKEGSTAVPSASSGVGTSTQGNELPAPPSSPTGVHAKTKNVRLTKTQDVEPTKPEKNNKSRRDEERERLHKVKEAAQAREARHRENQDREARDRETRAREARAKENRDREARANEVRDRENREKEKGDASATNQALKSPSKRTTKTGSSLGHKPPQHPSETSVSTSAADQKQPAIEISINKDIFKTGTTEQVAPESTQVKDQAGSDVTGQVTQAGKKVTGEVTHDCPEVRPEHVDLENTKPVDHYIDVINHGHHGADCPNASTKNQGKYAPEENSKLISVMHMSQEPQPLIYLFKFHASVSQSTIDGRKNPSRACAIIAVLFAQKFTKKPSIFPVEAPIRTLPDRVFQQAEEAIRDGNKMHELNFKGRLVDLGPDEVGLLMTHMGLRQVYETDVDTRELDKLVTEVMKIDSNQAIMFIKNYRVVSLVPCNHGDWLLLFDSHPHFVFTEHKRKMFGAYLFYARKQVDVIKDLFKYHDAFCDPKPFYGKLVIFEF